MLTTGIQTPFFQGTEWEFSAAAVVVVVCNSFHLNWNETKRMHNMDQMDRINIYDFFFRNEFRASDYFCHLFLYSRQTNYWNYTWSHVLTQYILGNIWCPLCPRIALLLRKKNGAQIHNSGIMVVISTIVG